MAPCVELTSEKGKTTLPRHTAQEATRRLESSAAQAHLDWPRLSNREQFKEEDEEADTGNDGKTTSKSGLALNGISYYGKLRTRGVEEAGCKFCSGAPTVSQTTG